MMGATAATATVDPLAHAFLPADPGCRGAVVDAAAGGCVPAGADVVVWRRTGASGPALRDAARRERDLRRLRARLPEPMRITAVHRLGAAGVRTGIRGRVRSILRGGLLVEIASPAAGPRVIDAVVAAAGVRLDDAAIHAGAGGTLVVPVRAGGERAILRVGRAGAPGDPAALAAALEPLAALAGPDLPVPRVRRRGVLGDTSWTLEDALPGRRPVRLTRALLRDAAAACARLPAGPGPPRAVIDDVRSAAALLPAAAAPLEAMADRLAPRLAGLPSIMRHGDLWSGNLLVARGALAGIVDWDAAHPAGVPGADLVQLIGTDWRRRARRPLGAAVLDPSWRRRARGPDAVGYWMTLGLRPTDDLLDLAGASWWAAEIHHTLRRFPRRASDAGWVAANVDSVLTALRA
jgi:hypothetical protein